MKISEELWSSASDIYERILSHEFLKEMADGTLEADKFRFYLAQDSIYLDSYVKALSYLAAKAPSSESRLLLLKRATNEVETALHSSLTTALGLEAKDRVQCPTCRAYSDFIISAAASEPFHLGIAALLPCDWTYLKLGEELIARMRSTNPYLPWAQAYSSEAYAEAVAEVLSVVDGLTVTEAELTKMKRYFRFGAYYEYLFWDSCYRMDRWEIGDLP